jgi:hypothetical protein
VPLGTSIAQNSPSKGTLDGALAAGIKIALIRTAAKKMRPIDFVIAPEKFFVLLFLIILRTSKGTLEGSSFCLFDMASRQQD